MLRNACLGLFLVAPATVGLAQPRDTTNGTGFPQRQRELTLTGRLSYDSNVLRGFQGPTGSGRRREDMIATPGVQILLVQPISRQDVFVTGAVRYDFYRYNKRLNRERIDLTGGAHLRAGQRCTATPSVNYQRALSDLGDIIDVSGTLQRVNVQETVDYGIDANCTAPYGIAVGGGYHHRTIGNSAPLRRALNVESDTANGNIGYSNPTLGTVSVYGTYTDGRYPNRLAGVGLDPGEGIESYSIGGRYERQLGTRFYSAVSVGWTRVLPRSAGTEGFSGLSYSGDLSYSRDPISAKIGFARNAEQSSLIQSSYAITTQFSGSVEYVLNDRLNFLANASYAKRRFVLSPTASPILAPRNSDRTYYAASGLRYKLTPAISVDLEGAYQERQATPDVFSYNSKQVVLTVRWAI